MAVYCYLTFPTTYFAIRAETLLKTTHHPFKMVPVPRSISSSCGTALRCACPEKELIEELLRQSAVEVEGVHEVEEKEFRLPRFFAKKEEPDE
jgi:hypothetical protein